jgi:hypothetical protein
MHALLFLLLVVLGCGCEQAQASSSTRMRHAFDNVDLVMHGVALPESKPIRVRRRVPPRSKADGYAGASSWCEGFVASACTSDDECHVLSRPHGRSLRCVRPYWAKKGDDTKVCASKWPSRREQAWRQQRLTAIVDSLCRGRCNAKELAAFLGVVAVRESTWRPWKAHRLNGDVRANRETWAQMAKKYAGNPYYRDRERWQGYGLFGENSPLFVYLWDPMAPPEVLCREVEAVVTYVERARIAARKQHNLGLRPTWATVHAALAAGEVRPRPETLARFRKQAARVGLNADRAVDERSFGRPLGTTVAARRLAAEILRARVDEMHPWPPPARGS